MKLRALSRDDVRSVDRIAIDEYGVPGVVLMENAGRGAATALERQGIRGPVTICCGKGNNGGDGYVMARHLELWGHDVHLLLTCDPLEVRGDALVNLKIASAGDIPLSRWGTPAARTLLQNSDWIVDGILGTGVQGEVHGPVRDAIAGLNDAPARKLAIDIPSGLDCDTGLPLGTAVRANHTVTFVGLKIGFAMPHAHPYTGSVEVVDIGVPAKLLLRYAG